MSKQQTSVIVKIGGRPAEDPACMGQLAAEIGALQETGINIAVVHGGGARLTAFCQKLGITARFTDGIRATGPDDMLAADQILAGEINTALVRLFASRQIPAVGLTGCDAGLCTARPLLEHTGTAGTTDTRILHLLWQAQLVPIIASVSQDAQGQAMNINADELARGLAIGLQASALVYISDIPGIRIRNQVASALTPAAIENEIASGEIRDGMVAKSRSAVLGVQEGIGTVCIGDYAVAGDLKALIEGKRGTQIGTA